MNFEPLLSEALSTIQTIITTFGLNLLAAILIFVAGVWAAQIIRRIVKKLLVQAGIDPTLYNFLATLTYWSVLALVAIAALNRLGVQTASLIALLGAAGLAIGLALQGSLANFAAGVLLIVFRYFRVGDWIEAADETGIVKEIQLFTTTLITLDNKTVIIPNAKLSNGNIVNYSAEGKIRLDLVIGVAYKENIDQVKRVMLEELHQHPLILHEPSPVVAVMELADSSVNFAVRPWTLPENYWRVYFDVHEQVKKRLDAEGITIPFPQRDVHFFPNN